MRQFDVPEPDYDRYTNRQLAAIPLAVLAVALAVIIGWFIFTGAPATLGIDFAGGTQLTVETSDDRDAIENAFDEEIENINEITGQDNQWSIESPSDDAEAMEQQAEENLTPAEGTDRVVLEASTFSASFGSDNQRTALYGVTAAFLGMAVLAFALFRTFVPSIAIVVSAFSDIMIPLAAMNLVGIPLSLGTVAGLLMLIGYSVDSDILLNNHILRRSGKFYESTYRAMQTGVTMTVTSLTAMAVLTVVAYLFGIGLLWQIGFVLVVGLMADLMNTYMLNLSLLRWYKFEGINR
ncbi:protein translocase subunit SecF [Natranaeroarchaeum aerophilus]|uniref:Protein-export membrane protein SecF n=1 Tax=Natranaeroarchaeum aerophilus TaxID=2917711 RepID=A0AAE3FR13_9EURY|nr:protein translocase subunit SecF [Natranaeroarchaeum aerophilus]MCL9813515.1 protein translocase subunit SecF [Natranaeroarchaeum aerophilus]